MEKIVIASGPVIVENDKALLVKQGEDDFWKFCGELADYLKSIGKLHLLHVNLIRYNETDKGCQPSSKETTLRFKDTLAKCGIAATIRKKPWI